MKKYPWNNPFQISLENPLIVSSKLQEGLTNFVIIDLSVQITIYNKYNYNYKNNIFNFVYAVPLICTEYQAIRIESQKSCQHRPFVSQILVIIFPVRYQEICPAELTQNRSRVLLRCFLLSILSTFLSQGM